MPFGIMSTNDMWMFSKRFEWIFEFQVSFKVYNYSSKYCIFTNSNFVMLVKQRIWNINKKYKNLFRHAIIPTYEYFILHSTMFSPHNTHINLPIFSLVSLANHAIFASIIVKLHFVTLLPNNTHITFPKFSTLSPCNTHIAFSNFHWFFWLIIAAN